MMAAGSTLQDGATTTMTKAGGATLTFDAVSFRYRQGLVASLLAKPVPPTISNVSLSVGAGECVGLIGESGSGKSTLARLALGFETPLSGRILVDDKAMDAWPGRTFRQTVQPIFQDPADALDPSMTILDQVAEPLIVQKLASRARARALAADRLAEVGLPAQVGPVMPHQISGGQAQRVVIARALMLRPRLLIADEPVSALDMTMQAQILNLLRDLIGGGLSCLFITHDLRAVSHLCDSLVVLYRGRVVEQGLTRDVLARPQHPYTRHLLDAVPKGKDERRALAKAQEPMSS